MSNHSEMLSSPAVATSAIDSTSPALIKQRATEAALVLGSATVVYSLVKLVLRVHEWRYKHQRAKECGIPMLVIPAQDWAILGFLPITKRNWHRFYEFRTDNYRELNSLTICRPAPLWMPNPLVHTCDPVVIKHILKDEFNRYIKNDPTASRPLQELLGEGIFLVDHGPNAADNGAAWTMQRKVASNIFTRSSFRGYMSDVFTRHALHLGDALEESLKDSSVVDMQAFMFKTTLDVIGEIGFGCQLNTLLDKQPKPFAVAFDRAQVMSFERILTPGWNIPLLGKLLYQSERDLARHIRTLDEFAYKVIKQRRKEREDANFETQSQDILSLFLAEKLNLSEKLLRDIVMSFMIAGRDTTACTLTFALLLLAQNPEKQELAREDVKRAMKDKRVATFEEIADMRYLFGCVQESLRLYPPVPVDGKVCIEDDILPDGSKVYALQRVFFEAYCIGRLSPLFKDDEPEAFKPERWLKMEKLPSAYEFPVFQAGPRICLGQNFAMLEAQIVLSFLLREGYRFRVVPDHKYTILPGFTIAVRNGMPLVVDKV